MHEEERKFLGRKIEYIDSVNNNYYHGQYYYATTIWLLGTRHSSKSFSQVK